MKKKKLVVALGAGLAVGLSANVIAEQGSSNPFQATAMTTAYNSQATQLASESIASDMKGTKIAMGKCGKGKCGANMKHGKKVDGSCGGKKADGSCGGKKADGSCGGKKADGSCGGKKADGLSGEKKAGDSNTATSVDDAAKKLEDAASGKSPGASPSN